MDMRICYTECEGITNDFYYLSDLEVYMLDCQDNNLEVHVFETDGTELKYTCNRSTGYQPVLEPLEEEED